MWDRIMEAKLAVKKYPPTIGRLVNYDGFSCLGLCF